MKDPIPYYIKPPIQQPTPPSEERLRMLLSQGPEFVDVVKDFIDKFKLPYTIDVDVMTGKGILKDTLSVGELHLKKFITEDRETIEMKNSALKMSKTPYEVLIIGETGTGKEIIAKSMIANRKGAIKAINCAGFPETLIEAELFGYVRGAFTGANETREGLILSAQDGVIFMDEIGELPLVMQSKLLRVIQEKRVRKVGATKDEDINCKFVFATNKELKLEVDKGFFRRDLYARISTLELHIKPLVDRMCDIEPITRNLFPPDGEKFLDKYKPQLMSGDLDLSLNVRSLQQYVIRYAVLGKINL